MYEHMIKVGTTVQNAIRILADLDKISIFLKNIVFPRGELIF